MKITGVEPELLIVSTFVLDNVRLGPLGGACLVTTHLPPLGVTDWATTHHHPDQTFMRRNGTKCNSFLDEFYLISRLTRKSGGKVSIP